MLDPQQELRALLDKQAITEVLLRYPRALDRCDEALLRSMFHEDATESHGGLIEGSAADFCTEAIRLMRLIVSAAHYILNIVIELDGDRAFVESYGIAFHRIEKDGVPYDSFFAARLIDRFERREGAWRIARREILYDWNRDVPSSEHWGYGVFGPTDAIRRGIKGPDDPVYQRR